MSNEVASRPMILIDLKKNRISITRKTLNFIGDPEYILLLVNPKEGTLALLHSNSLDKRAHRIPRIQPEKNRTFDLYSKALLKNLLAICGNWQDNCSYRIFGEFVQGEGVAKFHIDDSVPLCGIR